MGVLIEIPQKKIHPDNRIIRQPKDIYELAEIQNIKNSIQECLLLVNLNNKNAVLNISLLGLGKSNLIQVDTKDIIRNALINESDKVALVHNHPSGILEPSKEDINITITTGKLLKLFNIELIDHVIVSEKNYLSIFSERMIDKEFKSDKTQIVDQTLLMEENKKLKDKIKKLTKAKTRKYERSL